MIQSQDFLLSLVTWEQRVIYYYVIQLKSGQITNSFYENHHIGW